MPGLIESTLSSILAQIRKSSDELWTLVQDMEEYDAHTIALRRTLDCVILITPLSVIALTNLVHSYFILLCVEHGVILNQIYSLCIIANGSFCVGVFFMWQYWWTTPMTIDGNGDLYDRYIISHLLQASRLLSSLALVLYILVSGGSPHSAIPRFYVVFFIVLDIICAIKMLTSNWSLLNFLRSAFTTDTFSSMVNSTKAAYSIFELLILLLLALDVYKYHGVHTAGAFWSGGVLMVLCMLRMCCNSNCDIFRL